jgi:hypothetical protein
LGGKSGFCTEKSGFNAEKCLFLRETWFLRGRSGFYAGKSIFSAEKVVFMLEKVDCEQEKWATRRGKQVGHVLMFWHVNFVAEHNKNRKIGVDIEIVRSLYVFRLIYTPICRATACGNVVRQLRITYP